MKYTFHIVDVFSSTPFGGNQLENLLAHELFHIYLRREGFLTEHSNIARKQALAGSRELSFIIDAAVSLANCHADAVIDRRMTQRGFDPLLLNRRKKEHMMWTGNVPSDATEEQVRLYKRDIALTMYCLSLRTRDYSMEDIYKSFGSFYPTLEHDVEEISHGMGYDRCNSGPSCFAAILKLRRVSGFDGEVTFLNPATGKFE